MADDLWLMTFTSTWVTLWHGEFQGSTVTQPAIATPPKIVPSLLALASFIRQLFLSTLHSAWAHFYARLGVAMATRHVTTTWGRGASEELRFFEVVLID